MRDPEDPDVRACDEAAHERGIPISAIATGQSFYSDGWSPVDHDEDVRARLMERMQRIVDMAAPWSAFVVIGGVRGVLEGSPAEQEAGYGRAVDFFRRLGEYAASKNVKLAVEPINRYETNYINTISQGLQLIDDVDLDNMGILADTFHMNIEEADLAASLRLAGSHLLHTQFTDSNRLAAGRGHIDFPSLAAVLRAIGYEGYLSTETLPEPDSYTAAQQAIEYFRTL